MAQHVKEFQLFSEENGAHLSDDSNDLGNISVKTKQMSFNNKSLKHFRQISQGGDTSIQTGGRDSWLGDNSLDVIFTAHSPEQVHKKRELQLKKKSTFSN